MLLDVNSFSDLETCTHVVTSLHTVASVKSWLDNIKEWTRMDTPTLISKAEYRASWSRLAHSASLMSPLRPQRSGEWGEVVRWVTCFSLTLVQVNNYVHGSTRWNNGTLPVRKDVGESSRDLLCQRYRACQVESSGAHASHSFCVKGKGSVCSDPMDLSLHSLRWWSVGDEQVDKRLFSLCLLQFIPLVLNFSTFVYLFVCF